MSDLFFKYDIPTEIKELFQMVWENQYLEIDQQEGADLNMMIRKMINQLCSSYEAKTKWIFENLFFFFVKRAKMWLDVERLRDSDLELLFEEVSKYLNTRGKYMINEKNLKSILNKDKLEDHQLNEALYLIKLYAKFLGDELTSRLLIEEICVYSLTTESVVITLNQRRTLLKWILTEGIPSICLKKRPTPIEDFLYPE